MFKMFLDAVDNVANVIRKAFQRDRSDKVNDHVTSASLNVCCC